MTTVHELHPNIWVDRPAHEVWTRLTDPAAWPTFAPGVRAVEIDSPTTATVSLRWAGFPPSVHAVLTEWAPGKSLQFRTTNDLLTGSLTLTDVNPQTTALTLHAQYRPRDLGNSVAARLGLVGRELRGALIGFADWVIEQPALPDPLVPGGREAPIDPGELPVPPKVGLPHDLGVTGGAGHAAGSPGGGGSMGASSDRVDIGGRVGPAEDAAVPSVPDDDEDPEPGGTGRV
jgi:hypothetical protein